MNFNITRNRSGKLKRNTNYLIEEYVQGRELTVGIFKNKALDVIELKTKKKFYDYNLILNKYIVYLFLFLIVNVNLFLLHIMLF